MTSGILLLTHMLELPTDPAPSSVNHAQSVDKGRLETWREQRLLTRIQYDVPIEVAHNDDHRGSRTTMPASLNYPG